MNRILLDTLENKITSRPPVWFMRQAGRILPSYMKLKETYSFHELMNDRKLASKVTLLPIKDLEVDFCWVQLEIKDRSDFRKSRKKQ